MFDFRMSAAEVLAAREKLGWTQARLAYELGVVERTYRRWEKEGAPSAGSHAIQRMLKQEEVRNDVASAGSP